jgi:hypothetical protein
MGSLASYVSNMIRRLAALHYQSLLPSDARIVSSCAVFYEAAAKPAC